MNLADADAGAAGAWQETITKTSRSVVRRLAAPRSLARFLLAFSSFALTLFVSLALSL